MVLHGRMEGGREGCTSPRAKRVHTSRAARLELAWRAFGVLAAHAATGNDLLDRDQFTFLFDQVVEGLELVNDTKPMRQEVFDASEAETKEPWYVGETDTSGIVD